MEIHVFFPLLVQSGRRRGPSVNARAYSQYALACKCRSPVDEHIIDCDRGFLPNHKSCFSVFVLRAKNNYTFIIWLEIEILLENCVAENGKESRGGNLSFAKTSKYFLQRRVDRHNIYRRQWKIHILAPSLVTGYDFVSQKICLQLLWVMTTAEFLWSTSNHIQACLETNIRFLWGKAAVAY